MIKKSPLFIFAFALLLALPHLGQADVFEDLAGQSGENVDSLRRDVVLRLIEECTTERELQGKVTWLTWLEAEKTETKEGTYEVNFRYTGSFFSDLETEKSGRAVLISKVDGGQIDSPTEFRMKDLIFQERGTEIRFPKCQRTVLRKPGRRDLQSISMLTR